MSGMDSRIPARERAYAMIVALLAGVVLTVEQRRELRQRLQAPPGRPRKAFCLRGHARSPESVDARGACLACRRKPRYEFEAFRENAEVTDAE